MTENKPIIIDGIDVSGCEFVFVGKDKKAKIACWCNKLNFICKDNPNCYFKQLTRKTQECEELKSSRDYYKRIVDGCPEVCENGFCQIDFDNKRLKAKCEEFKETIQIQNKMQKEVCNEKNKELDQLKAEKEQIKKYLGISSKTIMKRLEELQEFRDRDRDKLYQAEQKLERIRKYFKNKDISQTSLFHINCIEQDILQII